MEVAGVVAMVDMSEMLIVPISAIPAQRFQVVLNNQNCTITIKKRGEHCYFSLVANGYDIADNVICLSGNSLVPYNTTHFVGTLFFIDKNGYYDTPRYEQFNTRFKLCYVPFRFDDIVDTSSAV